MEKGKNLEELFVTNVGSHTWRMNRPDSDLDLFIVYIADSKDILTGTCDIRSRFKKGVDEDRHTHEIGTVVQQILDDNNFNFIVGVLSPVVIRDWDRLEELRRLTLMNISKKCYHSINGLAYKNYHKYVVTEKDASEKRCNIIIRVLKFGIKILSENKIEFNSVKGRREDIPPLIKELKEAYDNSILPEEPVNKDAMLNWILNLRLEHLKKE